VPGKMCGTCSMFVEGRGKLHRTPSCTDVENPIYFDGVCDIFARAKRLPAHWPITAAADKSAAA
jgi:hypothetical protein